MKIVINVCYGGFGLSERAIEQLKKLGVERDYYRDIERNNPLLIQTVEHLGKEANGVCAELKIIEIPDGVEWYIEEYDGMEWVAEKHRTWE